MNRPNIVIIDCHDLGRHLNCYGHTTVTSPNVDRLAAGGVLFENSFCTAPQCSPSRASLYTGRYAHSNGMFGLAHDPFNWRLHDDEVYLARYLKDAGYDTALFGIQHVTGYTNEDVGVLGFDMYDRQSFARTEAGPNAAAYIAQHNGERPFFVNVGFVEPHRLDKGAFISIYETDDDKGVEVLPYLPDTPEGRQELAQLQGMIHQMDDGVGIILDALADNNLLDNTLVIFTADHGLALPRAKCSLYDPGIEIPMIWSWSGGGISGGKRLTETISHVDFVPTVLDILDLPVPERLHGRSYRALLQGGEYVPREEIFAEKTYHTAYEPMRSIRTDTHKLIVNLEVDLRVNLPGDIRWSKFAPAMHDQILGHRPHVELYDLKADSHEQHNLAGHPEVAEIERDLKQRLYAWMQATDDPLLNGPIPSPYYAETLRRLTEF